MATRDSERLILYGRRDCHLCDLMEEALRREGVAFQKVDVDSDPGLRARYGRRVPVLAGRSGHEICEGRVEPAVLRARLALE